MTLGILPGSSDAFMIKIWLTENRLCVLCVLIFYVQIISSSFIWLTGLKFLFLYKCYEINSTIVIVIRIWIHEWEISTLIWFYIDLEVISTKKLHLLKSQLTWLWQYNLQRSLVFTSIFTLSRNKIECKTSQIYSFSITYIIYFLLCSHICLH